MRERLCLVIVVWVLAATSAFAQPLSTAERETIDAGVRAVLDATGAPSASIAIVRGGQIVYENAYGVGRITPDTRGAPRYALRHRLGQQAVHRHGDPAAAGRRKLSLDDKVAKWFPQLTRAGDISIRQLLSMTSGYQDYWPQDYVFMDMQRPAPAREIMQRWAGKDLDFEPGTNGSTATPTT